MKDEEFGLGISLTHRELLFNDDGKIDWDELENEIKKKLRENDIKLIKKGIQIALDVLIEQDKYFEAWYISDIKCTLRELLTKDDFDY